MVVAVVVSVRRCCCWFSSWLLVDEEWIVEFDEVFTHRRDDDLEHTRELKVGERQQQQK